MACLYDGRDARWVLSSVSDRVELMKVVCDDSAIPGRLAVCVEDSIAARQRLELRREKREMEIAANGEAVPEKLASVK